MRNELTRIEKKISDTARLASIIYRIAGNLNSLHGNRHYYQQIPRKTNSVYNSIEPCDDFGKNYLKNNAIYNEISYLISSLLTAADEMEFL